MPEVQSAVAPAILTERKRIWASIRRSRVGKPALMVVAMLCAVYLGHRSIARNGKPEVARIRGGVRSTDLTDWRQIYAAGHTQAPRVSPGLDATFLEYLAAHFQPADELAPVPPPHIWITVAETRYVRSGVAKLDLFLRQLNSERAARFTRHPKPETRLAVLCLDDECLRECGQRQIYAYGGYERVRPPQVRRATWPKVGAFINVLPHRDLFFVDADVSFGA